MVLDATLLNTQYYKVSIKGKMEKSRELSCILLLHISVVAIEKEAFWSPSKKVANFTFYFYWFTDFPDLKIFLTTANQIELWRLTSTYSSVNANLVAFKSLAVLKCKQS